MPMKILWVSRGRVAGWLVCGAAEEWLQEGHFQVPLHSLWADLAQLLELLQETGIRESSLKD